jgi:hypothetical protein
MASTYPVAIDILDMDALLSEKEFHSQIAEYITYLEALSVSVSRNPGTVTFYPPPSEPDRFGCVGWSVRFVAIDSLGKKRASGLLHAYRGLIRLIESNLPHLEVHYEMSQFDFS